MGFISPFVWGVAETNYPAGANPWNATPVLAAPAADYFTPNTKPSAQNFNYVLNKIGKSLVALNDASCFGICSNWNTGVGASTVEVSATSVQAMAWDAYTQRWIASANGGGVGFPVSTDGGKSWLNTGTVQTTPNGPIAARDDNGDVIAVDPGVTVKFFPHSTGVGVSNAISGGTSSGTAATWFAGGSIWLVFMLGSISVSTSVNGTTWVGRTAALPTSTRTYPNAVDSWVAAQSPSTLVACLCANTPAQGSTLIYTINGTTYTDATPAWLSTKSVHGVSYSKADGIWGVVAYDGTSSYLYTTTDPTNNASWTLAKTFASQSVFGPINVGSVWAVHSSSGRLLASSNVASAGASSTWVACPFPSTSVSYNQMISNGNQIAVWSSSGVMTSITLGPHDYSAAY